MDALSKIVDPLFSPQSVNRFNLEVVDRVDLTNGMVHVVPKVMVKKLYKNTREETNLADETKGVFTIAIGISVVFTRAMCSLTQPRFEAINGTVGTVRDFDINERGEIQTIDIMIHGRAHRFGRDVTRRSDKDVIVSVKSFYLDNPCAVIPTNQTIKKENGYIDSESVPDDVRSKKGQELMGGVVGASLQAIKKGNYG